MKPTSTVGPGIKVFTEPFIIRAELNPPIEPVGPWTRATLASALRFFEHNTQPQAALYRLGLRRMTLHEASNGFEILLRSWERRT